MLKFWLNVRFIRSFFNIAFFTALTALPNHQNQRKPNIVILLADDVGIGDIGCYGNKTIRTPNIDGLCKKGVKLNHNLAAASVCTPSRAALLTGRYPIRFGYVSHNLSERRVTVSTTASGGLPPQETTFGEVLQQHGYVTGFFGKWHLGVHCERKDFCHSPLKNGFDYFYGLPLTNLMDCGPWSMWILQSEILKLPKLSHFYLFIVSLCCSYLFVKCSHKFIFFFLLLSWFTWYFQNIFLFFFFRQLNCVLMKNHDVIEQPFNLETLAKNIVAETNHFIRKNAKSPFLAYISFHHAHVGLMTDKQFVGTSSLHGAYGDTMHELDWAVGEIVSEIYKHDMINNTIIYFSSDHGPALGVVDELTGEYVGGWRGQYRGGKGSSFEGGIRVPTIVQWTGVFPAGHTINKPTSHLDLFPTLLSILNLSSSTQTNLDGENMFGLISGQNNRSGHRLFFHYCGSNLHAVTMEMNKNIWKVHFVIPKYETGIRHCFNDDIITLKRPIIYDLKKDPREEQSINPSELNYENILSKARTVVEEHQNTLNYHMPSQLTEEKNSFSITRINCCNFPLCFC